MTTQFLAIAPRGRFDQSSLELMTGENGTVLVRIIDANRMLALAVPLDLLQQQIAQLRVVQPTAKNSPARVLFSPLPAAETRSDTAIGSSGVDDAAGSPTGAASVPPRAAAPAQGITDRPLPTADVTGPEAASSPSATPRTEPARVTPAVMNRPRFPGARRDPNTPTGQRWSPA